MTNEERSLISPELSDLIGRDTPPREAHLTATLVERVRETIGERPGLWDGEIAPPYVLMAFGSDLPLPETPAAPTGLVTGDEWSLHRPLRVGERLTYTERLASVHERFASRFGMTLNLRTSATFRDAHGDVVAEAARGFIRYRTAPDQDGGPGRRQEGAVELPGQSVNGQPDLSSLPSLTAAPMEGDPLPEAFVRPGMGTIVRYCGLLWTFVPFFFDAEQARDAGLPGPIVPGPFKLALLTRYLATWAGPRGRVRAMRCAYRKPDPVGRPFTLAGAVRQVTRDGAHMQVDCEVWITNVNGERSVMGSGTVLLSE